MHAGTEDGAKEHTFYVCERWAAERGRLETGFDARPTPENTVTHMLDSEEVWELTNKVQRKGANERKMQALARQ